MYKRQAIEYVPGEAAPKILATGKGVIADKIIERAKESIRRMIVMNVIKQDEKLPSVRVLACKYAINPNTIAKAYKELEEEGLSLIHI